ncbi:hypothetical protein M501DRAFT_984921 [Patellaria atrata CBS 101060]|uniref:Uncharacterized protein n=1 Tax=Patellaria atrata CBS 101060 TaxID=1346257 RepID=A0A9P4SJ32_9PEZI|nr:hypothetical protein M501DRAFT_984921 [Patellaria atrata CBS 101060]
MPINIKKAWVRRKSEGNALDQFDTTAPSSFRVLTRPEKENSTDGSNSFTHLSGVRPFSTPLQQEGHSSLEDISLNSNRGSNGSSGANSALTRVYDTSSSSARFSSSSTLPSSTDVDAIEDSYYRKTEPKQKFMMSDSRTFSLRGAAKSFGLAQKNHKTTDSFTSKYASNPTQAGTSTENEYFKENKALPRLPTDTMLDYGSSRNTYGGPRDRSTTESSYASTAVPPRVDGGEILPSTDFDSGFGDLFGGIGKTRNIILEEPAPARQPHYTPARSESEPTLALPIRTPANTKLKSNANFTPSPISVDRDRYVESSPYSWDSGHSNDGLMSSPYNNGSPITEQGPPVPPHSTPDALSSSITAPEPSAPTATERHNGRYYAPARNNTSPAPQVVRTQSRTQELRQEDRNNSRQLLSTSSSNKSLQTPSLSSGSSSKAQDNIFAPENRETTTPVPGLGNDKPPSNDSTPRPRKIETRGLRDDVPFDTAIAASANLTLKYSEPPEKLKVLTESEFKNKQRQMANVQVNQAESDSEEEDSYEDADDEEERLRKTAAQRSKQQAFLAVHRQKMQKVTGEPANPISMNQNRPTFDRNSMSSPSVLIGGTGASDDEDENIPLGILAAHGFPRANRPPTRLNQSTSNSNLRAASQAASIVRPGSAAAKSVSGASMVNAPRSSLPAFARNLPSDPFAVPGMPMGPTREPLPFGRNNTASVYGGFGATPPSLPPNGLVGVIDREERERAMRRGSPNAGQFGNGPVPQAMPQMGMGMNMGMQWDPSGGFGMDMPMMPSMQIPTQQDQLLQMMAMQQQQMVQMQMHFMSTMMNQSNGIAPQLPQVNMLSTAGQQRPMSMASNRSHGVAPMGNQQAYSGLNLGTSWDTKSRLGVNTGYAASLAPSERSNVGMASRYRPVQHSGQDGASSVTASTTLPNKSARSTQLSNPNIRVPSREPSPGTIPESKPKSGFLSATLRSVSRKPSKADANDDDDDEWTDVKKKRAPKKAVDNPYQNLYYDGV